MKRTAPVLLALALTTTASACSGDEPLRSSPTIGSDTASAPASPSAPESASPQSPPSPSSSPSASPSTPASDTSVDEQEPTGGPLSVRAVRVARQPDVDRVVFELAGKNAGAPGWRVEYVERATQQGSGDPVDVEGEFTLSVTITGTGYPFDTGVDEVEDDPSLPGDLEIVEDVVLGAVFEGQYEAFVGTSTQAPFRVYRLADPARVVIDLRRG